MLRKIGIGIVFVLAGASIVYADCTLINQDPARYKDTKGETDFGAMQDEVIKNNGTAVYGVEDGYNYIKDCPDDVSTLIDREVSCVHFAGEIGGTDSEEDKEANTAMDELGCGTQKFECSRHNLLDKYKKDKTIYDTVLNALKIIYGKDDYNKTMEYTEKLKCQKY